MTRGDYDCLNKWLFTGRYYMPKNIFEINFHSDDIHWLQYFRENKLYFKQFCYISR